MAKAQIKHTAEGLEVITPYDGQFLAALKRLVPASERRWRKPVWIVHPRHESEVCDMVHVFFGRFEFISGGEEKTGGLALIQQVQQLTVEYIGACRQRDGESEPSAFGWSDGDWNVVFSETVLRLFFNAPASASKGKIDASTLYAMLGIDKTASVEIVKSAYRRAARQWHPDVNGEPEAATMFRRISDAYQILSDTRQRARYDAGLALQEAGDAIPFDSPFSVGDLVMAYRAPFTCGLIQFKGYRSLGRWIVEEILSWDDIINEQGQVMVSSWNKLMDKFETSWISRDYEVEL